jgi:uncharacterized iron-regulated protein
VTRRASCRQWWFLLLVGAVAACDGGGTLAGQPPGPTTTPDAGLGPVPTGYIGMLPITDRPYRLARGRGASAGAPMRLSDLVSDLTGADAVCLGEQHDDPNSHAVQLLVLDLFASQTVTAGHGRALGMEMFQLPFQGTLDEYTAGAIDEATMLLRTQWAQRWGFDFGMYRPVVNRMLDAQGSLRALNARDEIVKKVAEQGLASLTVDERAQLPDLDLGNAEHRAWFERTITAVGGHGGVALDNSYAAQVVRDETMADTAWSWLSAQPASPRQLAIAAGNGHCIDLAIPARLRRRGARTVVIIRPLPEEAFADTLVEALSDVLVIFVR